MTRLIEKLKTLPTSRRFWTAGTAIIVVILSDVIGLPDDTAREIAALLAVWILGDSIKHTQ